MLLTRRIEAGEDGTGDCDVEPQQAGGVDAGVGDADPRHAGAHCLRQSAKDRAPKVSEPCAQIWS